MSDEEIEAAYRRRDHELATQPLAVGVRYHRGRDAVVVTMNNESQLTIPRRLLQGLQDATPQQLQGGIVAEKGTALTWPALDADFTVLSLLRGVYGGRRWMSEPRKKPLTAKRSSKGKR